MKKFKVLFALVFLATIISAQQRIVLIEEFSSSTCPPCKTFNVNYFGPFLENPDYDGQYVVVDYRMSWPGSGDPYYTAEAGTRRSYYGVNGVPTCYFDGSEVDYSSMMSTTGFETAFEDAYAKGTNLGLSATYKIDGNTPNLATASVTAVIKPPSSLSGKLYAAVVERVTTENVGTNGETEFHYVMMKMLPDANGTSINVSSGDSLVVTKDASLAGTNIEEMTDLKVAVWVQKGDKSVLNSVFAKEEDLSPLKKIETITSKANFIRYNTATNSLNLRNRAGDNFTIYDASGKSIVSKKLTMENEELNLKTLHGGCYIAVLNSKGFKSYAKILR